MQELLTNFRWGLTGEPQEMLVEHGRVVWRGRGDGPLGAEAKRTDLQGNILLPKFIDNHCHVLPTGLDLAKLHLGKCQSPQDVLNAVQDRLPAVAPGRWLHAVHYDQTKFPGAKHLGRGDLDRISATVPILLRHVNGHASVANSAALAAAGINEDTPDPRGGEYVRDESGRKTGVLLEKAHEHVAAAGTRLTEEEMVQGILLAGEKMSELGIGCATDMMTGYHDLLMELRAYRLASERGCQVRLRLFMQWSPVLGPRACPPEAIQAEINAMDPDRCRVIGVKIFADGGISSGTAAIHGGYLTDPNNDGKLIYAPDRLNDMVRIAHEAGHRIAIHSIGDRSTDVVMDALEQAGEARRHRIEHVMMLSDEQIARLKRLGCAVTMQPEFLMRLGHAYRRQLPPDRAATLKRARSVIDAGIPLSFSSDRPIVAGDPWDGIRTAVNRPEGYASEESVTIEEALLAYTAWAADANGDAEHMGSLEAGQLADYQVLESIPV